MPKGNRTSEGIVGGALTGFFLGGPAGAVAGALSGGLLGESVSESKHNHTLRQVATAVNENMNSSASLYVDHIDVGDAADGTPEGVVEGINRIPDLVVTDFGGPSLIIEVETLSGLKDNSAHAIEQMNDFRKPGYTRCMAVPENELEDVYDWLENNESNGKIEGPEVQLLSPERISGLY